MIWAGHVARMGRRGFFVKKKQEESDQYEDLDVGGRILLKCM
jgi:hypothetical protein